MTFEKIKENIWIRVGLLTLTLFLLTNTFYTDSFVVVQLFFLMAALFQVISLVGYIKTSLDPLTDKRAPDDISSALTGDPEDEENHSILNHDLAGGSKKGYKPKKEKEDEFQYLKNIVHHVGIGLITFNASGKVQIINTAAKNLLRIRKVDNIEELQELSRTLVDSFFRLRTGGRDLVRVEIGGEIIQLAVYAIQLTLRGEEFKLVSLQNIQSELEEKEMEAWQNLVRVLTHEIMNSITPITSLAATIDEDISRHDFTNKENVLVPAGEVEDIQMAVQTIKRRSQGLIRFVQDFRNLAHIPKPKVSLIKVSTLFQEILVLMKKEISDHGVKVSVITDPETICINADKELITQVLINLVKNAIQAFDEHTNKIIELKAFPGEKGRPVISVRDNGSGIDEEALEKIFIPFFTTKKSGSGIGLSLSRQIMRQHQGILGVKSKPEEGTEFLLKF